MLETARFIDATPDPANTALEPRQCPRCKALNTHDALFCAKCSMALVEEAAKQSVDYLRLLLQIKRDLGLS